MSFLINSNATSVLKITDTNVKSFEMELNGDGVKEKLTFDPKTGKLTARVSQNGGGTTEQDLSALVNQDPDSDSASASPNNPFELRLFHYKTPAKGVNPERFILGVEYGKSGAEDVNVPTYQVAEFKQGGAAKVGVDRNSLDTISAANRLVSDINDSSDERAVLQSIDEFNALNNEVTTLSADVSKGLNNLQNEKNAMANRLNGDSGRTELRNNYIYIFHDSEFTTEDRGRYEAARNQLLPQLDAIDASVARYEAASKELNNKINALKEKTKQRDAAKAKLQQDINNLSPSPNKTTLSKTFGPNGSEWKNEPNFQALAQDAENSKKSLDDAKAIVKDRAIRDRNDLAAMDRNARSRANGGTEFDGRNYGRRGWAGDNWRNVVNPSTPNLSNAERIKESPTGVAQQALGVNVTTAVNNLTFGSQKAQSISTAIQTNQSAFNGLKGQIPSSLSPVQGRPHTYRITQEAINQVKAAAPGDFNALGALTGGPEAQKAINQLQAAELTGGQTIDGDLGGFRAIRNSAPITISTPFYANGFDGASQSVRSTAQAHNQRAETVLRTLAAIEAGGPSAPTLKSLVTEAVGNVMNATEAAPPAPIDLVLANMALSENADLSSTSIAEIKKIASNYSAGGLYEGANIQSGANTPVNKQITLYLMTNDQGQQYFTPNPPSAEDIQKGRSLGAVNAIVGAKYNIKVGEGESRGVQGSTGQVTFTSEYNVTKSIANWDGKIITNAKTAEVSTTNGTNTTTGTVTTNTSGLDVGTEVKGKGGIPGIGEVEVTAKVNVHTSTSVARQDLKTVIQSNTQTNSETNSVTSDTKVIDTTAQGNTESISVTADVNNSTATLYVIQPVTEYVITDGAYQGVIIRDLGKVQTQVDVTNGVKETDISKSATDSVVQNGVTYIRADNDGGDIRSDRYAWVKESDLTSQINRWTQTLRQGGDYEKSVDLSMTLFNAANSAEQSSTGNPSVIPTQAPTTFPIVVAQNAVPTQPTPQPASKPAPQPAPKPATLQQGTQAFQSQVTTPIVRPLANSVQTSVGSVPTTISDHNQMLQWAGGDMGRYANVTQLMTYLGGSTATFDSSLGGGGGWAFSTPWGKVEFRADGSASGPAGISVPPLASAAQQPSQTTPNYSAANSAAESPVVTLNTAPPAPKPVVSNPTPQPQPVQAAAPKPVVAPTAAQAPSNAPTAQTRLWSDNGNGFIQTPAGAMPKVLNDSRVAQEIMYGGDIARWDKANQLTVYLNGQSATFDPTLRGVGGWSFSAWWGRIEILANGAAYNNGVMALPPYGSVSNANVA